ncbi:hypothetical protein [Streptomyces beigongshangae]|uniref:hypothetical protein n=1 Tax=Streptomyces beigongshangae TaxID=2841597 RepID=UPI001C860A7E|nr:hypothetical protein [Streptomyces sp. REN17]
MSTATFTPAIVRPLPPSGVTAPRDGRRHRLGDALRAVRVFTGATLGVVLLGECDEEAGVRRR